MLTIRFNRVGKRNKAYFRIVVQEHTVAPGGRHVEVLGSYDPRLKKGSFEKERIGYWIEKGAQVSDSVYNLLIREKVIEGKKRPIKIKKKREDKTELKEESKKPEEKKEATKKEEPKAEETKTEKTEEKIKEKNTKTHEGKLEEPKA
ncbi:MAG: 30S ribosomal protein S16 [Candidatus Moranbacteria bacterium]|nr:30S ribosomal protein S16 [Candidatus Moranbacteria bacterium]